MRVCGLVPAAGRSSRMGRPKALLTYRGQSWVERIVGQLAEAGVAETVVVAAADDRPLQAEVARISARLALNPEPDRGMLSSILAGLAALGAPGPEAVILWPVDYPAVRAATVRALVDAFAAQPAPVVVPCHDGQPGHPVLLGRSTFGELRAAPPEVGARAVIRAHAAERRRVEVDDPGILRDIDRPEDLERLG